MNKIIENINQVDKNIELENYYFKYDLNFVKEYLKWLSFIPDEKQKSIKEILRKNASDLTTNEINELAEYKEQQEMTTIIKRYTSNIYKSGDCVKIQNYINKTSLDDLISTKLTDEDYEVAEVIIEKFLELPYDDLCRNIVELKNMNVSKTPTIEYVIYELCKICGNNIEETRYNKNDSSKLKIYK